MERGSGEGEEIETGTRGRGRKGGTLLSIYKLGSESTQVVQAYLRNSFGTFITTHVVVQMQNPQLLSVLNKFFNRHASMYRAAHILERQLLQSFLEATLPCRYIRVDTASSSLQTLFERFIMLRRQAWHNLPCEDDSLTKEATHLLTDGTCQCSDSFLAERVVTHIQVTQLGPCKGPTDNPQRLQGFVLRSTCYNI